MGDENLILTLGDYSKPSHEGYRNTIELPVGNNVARQFGLISLPARSIPTWEDLTTRFLAQFFPPGRTVKLRNDILMFQQHHGESLSEAWTHFKDLLQKVPHHGIDLWLQDLALYDNKSWNDPRDFAKPVKAIALPQDVPINKVTTLYEIYSGPHDTQYYMEDPEQAFVEYASSLTDEAGDARLSKFEADFKHQTRLKQMLKVITDRIARALPRDTTKNPKLSTTLVLSARSYPTIDSQCSYHPSTLINAIKAHFKEATISQTSLRRPEIKIEPQQPKDRTKS
ncbi:MAK10-like protein [Tanacetum coccineum]